MKKLIILAIPLLFLAGCGDFEPLIDLKASEGEKAKHAQEDHMECEWLIEKFTEGLERQIKRLKSGTWDLTFDT